MPGHPGRRAAREHRAPDLESQVQALLTNEDRLGLLGLASSMLSALEPEPAGPSASEEQTDLPSLPEVPVSLASPRYLTGRQRHYLLLLARAEDELGL